MPYVQVLAMINCFAYIGFCLTDGILKPVVAGSEGGNGGRQRAARTMKIATLYLLLFEQAESVVAIKHIAHCGSGTSGRLLPIRHNDSGLPVREPLVSYPPHL